MKKLNVTQIGLNITTLGFGSRAVVWFQGCHIGCSNCSSMHTHNPRNGHLLNPSQIIDWLDRQHHPFDGLTISGGEPTEQAEGVIALIKAYREAFAGDVLLFTGLPWRLLMARHKNLIEYCDLIVAGPFVERLPALPMRGSSNQSIHVLTQLAQTRYQDINTWSVRDTQVAFNDKQLVTVGIPDIALQSQIMNNSAFETATASWLPNNGA